MAEDSLLSSGYFQVTPSSSPSAATLAERGRTKVLSRQLNQRNKRRKANAIRDQRSMHQEIIRLLDRLSHRLKEQGKEVNFSFLEIPDGFMLRAYDCGTNQQVCQLISERFIHSPERLKKLILEAITGMGTLFDIRI
ncbi:MAG: hypothetical protein GWP07_00620 [Xanthomonadaceae bacterium]|nr:hypothetical protein [Xanthomonadaceae bacterium]